MNKPCETCLVGYRGHRVTKVICTRKDHPMYKQMVNQETCENCAQIKVAGIPPQRPQEAHMGDVEIGPLGTLIYTRTHWEPPPCPPGYRARSSDQNSNDAWILEPIDVVCKHLELVPSDTGACGYQRAAKRCKLVQSFIGQRSCSICPRKE